MQQQTPTHTSTTWNSHVPESRGGEQWQRGGRGGQRGRGRGRGRGQDE